MVGPRDYHTYVLDALADAVVMRLEEEMAQGDHRELTSLSAKWPRGAAAAVVRRCSGELDRVLDVFIASKTNASATSRREHLYLRGATMGRGVPAAAVDSSCQAEP